MASTCARSKSAIPFLAAAALALVLYASPVSANQLYAVWDQYINYAQECDQTDTLMRAAYLRGEKEIVVVNSDNWTHLNMLPFTLSILQNTFYRTRRIS
jgi:hypothetical protein